VLAGAYLAFIESSPMGLIQSFASSVLLTLLFTLLTLSSASELHSSINTMNSPKRQKLDVDYKQIAENLTADEALVWNRLIVNKEPRGSEESESRKQHLDGGVSIDHLSDEIMLLVINFMYGFDFDANQTVFDNGSGSDLEQNDGSSATPSPPVGPLPFPKTVKISHVNIMKKLEPLRHVCKAWNTLINMFYNYKPWTLSLTSQDNIILPLVLLHQPQIKSLHIEPSTATEMCLQLHFLHIYDLRQMETLLIDRAGYQEIYSLHPNESYEDTFWSKFQTFPIFKRNY
jgi:hypothetical protein